MCFNNKVRKKVFAFATVCSLLVCDQLSAGNGLFSEGSGSSRGKSGSESLNSKMFSLFSAKQQKYDNRSVAHAPALNPGGSQFDTDKNFAKIYRKSLAKKENSQKRLTETPKGSDYEMSGSSPLISGAEDDLSYYIARGAQKVETNDSGWENKDFIPAPETKDLSDHVDYVFGGLKKVFTSDESTQEDVLFAQKKNNNTSKSKAQPNSSQNFMQKGNSSSADTKKEMYENKTKADLKKTFSDHSGSKPEANKRFANYTPFQNDPKRSGMDQNDSSTIDLSLNYQEEDFYRSNDFVFEENGKAENFAEQSIADLETKNQESSFFAGSNNGSSLLTMLKSFVRKGEERNSTSTVAGDTKVMGQDKERFELESWKQKPLSRQQRNTTDPAEVVVPSQVDSNSKRTKSKPPYPPKKVLEKKEKKYYKNFSRYKNRHEAM